MKNLFFALGLLFVLVLSSQFTAAQNRAKLFEIKKVPAAKSIKSSIASVRESEISIDFSNFRQTETLEIPLFDGKTYFAGKTETEVRAMDEFSWRGKIPQGNFSGAGIITLRKGYVSGLIYAPNAVYEIVLQGEKQVLVELDQSLFPECGGELKGAETKTIQTENIGAGTDSGDRIDVLVIYTTAVKNSLGGDIQAQAFAQQAIDSTNTAYINSKIRQRVRLIAAQETTLAEVGSLQTELSNVRNDATVANLRNQVNADLVAMLSNTSDA